MNKYVAYLIAIVVGFLTGLAITIANPHCYQEVKGVVTFHPSVFFFSMLILGFLINKFGSLKETIGSTIFALAITAFPAGIAAPGFYYNGFQFIAVGIICLLAAYVLTSSTIVESRYEAKKLAGIDTPFKRY